MACVGQGAVYVGGAIGALRVMAARAEAKRGAAADSERPQPQERVTEATPT
jgi:hypothetical protein